MKAPKSEDAPPTRGRPRKTHSGGASARGKKAGPQASTANVDVRASRHSILEKAAALFSRKSYSGTTMADIADAVGIRSPSLYYHFPDKAGILKAIADISLEGAVGDAEALLAERTKSAPERLYLLVHNLVWRLRESPYDLYCMFDPVFFESEFREVNTKLVSWLHDMEKLISEGIADGTLAPTNPKLAAYAVRGLVESAIRMTGAYSLMPSEHVAHVFGDFARNALTIRPDSGPRPEKKPRRPRQPAQST